MKVSDVMTRVRVMVGDTDALQFTDAQLLSWINDGVRECAVMNNLLQKRANSNTVVGQSDYSLPTDILKLHSVKYDNDKIRIVTLEEFDQWFTGVGTQTTTGPATPEIGYIWAGKLTVYPSPSQVKTLTIDYLYDPPLHTDATTDTELGLPISYHARIVDYCLAQVAQQDDDLNRYSIKMQEFKTGVASLSDQNEYTYDLYPSISVSDRDAGDNYEWS